MGHFGRIRASRPCGKSSAKDREGLRGQCRYKEHHSTDYGKGKNQSQYFYLCSHWLGVAEPAQTGCRVSG